MSSAIEQEAPFAVTGRAFPTVVAADLGASKISIVPFSLINERLPEVLPTPKDLDTAVGSLATYASITLDGSKPDVVGIGIAGEVDEDGMTIVRAGKLQEYGFVGQPIKEMVAEEFGIPSDNVVLINDGGAAGLAERDVAKREGRLTAGYEGFVETISSGDGGAIYDKEGAVNVEPGHIPSLEEELRECGCGRNDCIEPFVGGNYLVEEAGGKLENVPFNDPFWSLYRERFNRLQLVKLEELRDRGYDPQRWSFYGSVALKGPRVFNSFKYFMLNRQPGIVVAKAQYGDLSTLYGAGVAANELAAA